MSQENGVGARLKRGYSYDRLASEYAEVGLAEPVSWKRGGISRADLKVREDRVAAHLYDIFGAHPDWPSIYNDERGGIAASPPDDAGATCEPQMAKAAAGFFTEEPAALHDLVPLHDGRPVWRPKSQIIIREVCEWAGVSKADLMSYRRTSHISRARQVAMWRIYHESKLSLPAVGRIMGGRDHTTVLYAERKIASLLKDGSLELPKGWGACRAMEAAE